MVEYRKETVGQTTADLAAEVMREMEEVERIATSSNNLKGTYVRRLRQASRKVRAIGAELQQRTVVPVGYPVNPDGKSKMEEEIARPRSRVRDLENVSRILGTVGRLFDTAVEKRSEKETRPTLDERGTTVGAERGIKDMTPGVSTAIMGPPSPPPPHDKARA
jgi:RNase H-fold protein (predicted Holliday junction resolvase)